MTFIRAHDAFADCVRMSDSFEATAKNIVAAVAEHARADAAGTTLFNDGPKKKLRKSIRVSGGGFRLNLRAGTDHAVFIENGTKAHPISPKAKDGKLTFQINGQWRSTKKTINHPGTKARPFMEIASDAAEYNAPNIAAEHMNRWNR